MDWRISKKVLFYGISLAFLLLSLKVIEYRYQVRNFSVDLYLGVLALIFTSLGIWITYKILIDKSVSRTFSTRANLTPLARPMLTEREIQVLQYMADGLSNQEIAEHLFISIHTVKSHATNIFEKLEVRRRTQAIAKAKDLGILSNAVSDS